MQALQPELDAALRAKYMAYLAFRRREREDQLERMVLDLTAVETFPPELATADKDDAADGMLASRLAYATLAFNLQ